MITSITEAEFTSIDPVNRVIVHDHARKFARLRPPHATCPLGMSWRSDLIEPTLAEDQKSSVLWVGVDQRLVCVALDGGVRFSVALASPLLQIRIFPEFTVALCETGFLVVNQDASIRRMEELSDVLDSVDVQDGKVVVSLLDGGSRSYSI